VGWILYYLKSGREIRSVAVPPDDAGRDAHRSGDRIQTEINYLLWEVGFFVCPCGIPRVRLRNDGTGIGIESDTGTGGDLLWLWLPAVTGIGDGAVTDTGVRNYDGIRVNLFF
jgi:hypothetical protein